MLIKNNKIKKKETVKNKSTGSLSLLFLIICLIVIIIMNFVQLIDLIENINEINETLKNISSISSNYTSLNELKNTYIVQLVKSIFVLLAEIFGLFVCNYFSNNLNLINQKLNSNKSE